jgi:Poxvirus Late Transcription Factor VLTF3 like
MCEVTDIKSLDSQIRQLLSQEDLSLYIELTKDLLQSYSKYPRRVNFMAKTKDEEKERIINDFIIRTLLVFRGPASPTASFAGPNQQSSNQFGEVGERIAQASVSGTRIRDSMMEYITKVRRKKSVISEGKCQECSSDSLSMDSDTGNLVCMSCGFEMLDLSDRNIAYRDAETMTVIRKPIYERTKHFRDLVNQYQGKLTRSIDSEIIDQLRECFRINGIDPRTVTRRNICTFLLELNHSECYDSVNYLYSHFTGLGLPDLSGVEEQLFRDYDMLQKAYNELSSSEKQERNNFLKGIQVFECLLKKNHIPYEPESFSQLKTEDRMRKYDNILEQLFKRLEWTYPR